MKVKRGNPDRLEGRVSIYSQNISPDKDSGAYHSVYCSTNPSDLYVIGRILSKDDNNLDQQIPDLEARFSEMQRSLAQEGNSAAISPLSFISFSVNKLNTVFSLPGDVVDAGKAEDNLCGPLLEAGIKWYTINYSAQVFQAMQEFEADLKDVKAPDSFRNYTPDALTKKLTELVGQSLYAVETQNPILRADVQSTLRQISQGAPFSRELDEMSAFLSSDKPVNPKLVELYITMIGSIAREDYRSAAKTKSNITELLRSQEQ